MTKSIWVQADNPLGELIDISKAFTLRVEHTKSKGKEYWHIQAEFPILEAGGMVERTIDTFDNECDAQEFMSHLVPIIAPLPRQLAPGGKFKPIPKFRCY